MKAARRGDVERALRAPDGRARFFLLHGPDDAGSRALAALLGAAMGEGAEKVELSGAELKADPARLADEAASISMFGGPRWILVDPAGDECVPALEALLATPAAASPVALVAGALKPASKLLKLALAEKQALAFASWPPKPEEADRLTREMGRAEGLRLRTDVSRRIAESCAGNRALIAQELAKLAAYADASPEAPRDLDHDALDAVGAGGQEGDLAQLVDAVAGGDPAGVETELVRLRSEGRDGIVLLRAVLRRMLLLARLRAEVESGNSVSAVMTANDKSLFWKEKAPVERQLSRWRAPLVARAIDRLAEAERAIKASGGPGPLAADAELHAIARQAQRLR